MTNLIEVRHLEKSYLKKQVIHNISFSIKKGEILCLLGPNGAAKSTTINILCGALSYDQGEILYHEEKIEKNLSNYKEKLGIVPQELALYEDLSAENNIQFFASLYGLKGKKLKDGVDFALKSVGLMEHRKEKVETFSGGMKRRLNIACAIAHEPELLIMDEPTVGIDPQSRNHILEAIQKMRQEGMTILYTTHYMEEVEEISTRIIIMDHGRIIAEGTKESLKDRKKEKEILIQLANSSNLSLSELYQVEGITKIQHEGNELMITVIKGVENLDAIMAKLTRQNQKIQNVRIETDNLETVFLDLTGRSLRDAR